MSAVEDFEITGTPAATPCASPETESAPLSSPGATVADEQEDDFRCELDAEIARSMKDREYAAAFRRAERRDLTYGLDKRQARRLVRRLDLKGSDRG